MKLYYTQTGGRRASNYFKEKKDAESRAASQNEKAAELGITARYDVGEKDSEGIPASQIS